MTGNVKLFIAVVLVVAFGFATYYNSEGQEHEAEAFRALFIGLVVVAIALVGSDTIDKPQIIFRFFGFMREEMMKGVTVLHQRTFEVVDGNLLIAAERRDLWSVQELLKRSSRTAVDSVWATATTQGHEVMMAAILQQFPELVNVPLFENGGTAAHCAAAKKDWDLVIWLQSHGADLAQKDCCGKSVLDLLPKEVHERCKKIHYQMFAESSKEMIILTPMGVISMGSVRVQHRKFALPEKEEPSAGNQEGGVSEEDINPC